ncbi:MAG: hypothetical protein IJH68_06345 [Thermoguttaceae bacterium]|nr:hypothetical protein [Thermoguttaceae bacterium]
MNGQAAGNHQAEQPFTLRTERMNSQSRQEPPDGTAKAAGTHRAEQPFTLRTARMNSQAARNRRTEQPKPPEHTGGKTPPLRGGWEG